MILSILIPTLPQRKEMLDSLLENLNKQLYYYQNDVEVIIDNGTGDTIGKKRNLMLQLAKGDFVVFIDDDDDIAHDYLESIIGAIKENPNADCIGMNGIITTDGVQQRKWSISIEHGSWHEKDGVYYRTPNHISPVKREIANMVGFTDKTMGEDYDYSMGILPLLKKETFINKELYHYKYVTTK
jgi:hypothetical protein